MWFCFISEGVGPFFALHFLEFCFSACKPLLYRKFCKIVTISNARVVWAEVIISVFASMSIYISTDYKSNVFRNSQTREGSSMR